MSLFARLRSIRIILAAGVVLRAAAWGAAGAITLIIGAALVDLAAPLSLQLRGLLLVFAVVGALVITIALCWRDRAVFALDRVALWIEERVPSLEYTLVTAVETGDAALVTQPAMDSWTRIAWRRAAGVLRAPAVVVVLAVVVLLLLPAGAVARMRSPHAGDSLDRPSVGAGSANRLSPLVADVVPPAYSGERAVTVDEPSDISALEGSQLTLRGRGDGAGIVAYVNTDSVPAVNRAGRWTIVLRVSARPVAIRLQDGGSRRIVAIEPIIDNPPIVNLSTPARDSVLRSGTGRIPLTADVNDDIGIASAAFEYIVSSGEGETFTFKSGTLGRAQPRGTTASIAVSLSLDSLALKPGDIVHLRAVARDANNVSGPGVGASETRAIRIARPDEYDSVAVDPAGPSEADKGMISQRMLIILAEALQKKRPTLTRETLVAESRAIAVDQKKLRRAVGDVVFTRLGGAPSGEEGGAEESPARAKTMEELLRRADSATNVSTDPLDFEGGESPVVAVNKPLLEAYNAMWEASTHLELAEPDRALPFMRRALEAIQRARKAERVYLRGTPPRIVIDISKARLKGKDRGSSSARRGLTSADSATRIRTDRFTRIVELSARDPQAAVDSLLVLRIDALGEAPAFAAALSDAVKAMRTGKSDEATTALARARRTLGGSPVARDTLSRWGIVP